MAHTSKPSFSSLSLILAFRIVSTEESFFQLSPTSRLGIIKTTPTLLFSNSVSNDLKQGRHRLKGHILRAM